METAFYETRIFSIVSNNKSPTKHEVDFGQHTSIHPLRAEVIATKFWPTDKQNDGRRRWFQYTTHSLSEGIITQSKINDFGLNKNNIFFAVNILYLYFIGKSRTRRKHTSNYLVWWRDCLIFLKGEYPTA